MTQLAIRDIFRYGRPYQTTPAVSDQLINHFHITNYPGKALVLLEKGINPIAQVEAPEGKRIPAILIRSSPHKIGSETTPWQDDFDVDNGRIRYYGDNKKPGTDPALAPGNKVLLKAFNDYNDLEKRQYAVPLIFYKAVSHGNKSKGFIEFNGFGIIKAVELVTQFDRKLNRTFANYAFDFQVFSIAEEHETFSWNWINARRDKRLSIEQTLAQAPASWRDWIKNGPKALEKNRRRVSKLLTVGKQEQIPAAGSREAKLLEEVYQYYTAKKASFEGLAAAVTAKILKDSGERYTEGWITPASSDGGADFYGRIEIGTGFGRAKLILLGQAKCEHPGTPTGGNHIARTVARLRRGWVGAYVTTSYFSEPVQREVIEDEYPVMLINGKKVAETILKILHDEGHLQVNDYLDYLQSIYVEQVQIKRPDELLHIV